MPGKKKGFRFPVADAGRGCYVERARSSAVSCSHHTPHRGCRLLLSCSIDTCSEHTLQVPVLERTKDVHVSSFMGEQYEAAEVAGYQVVVDVRMQLLAISSCGANSVCPD